MNFTHAVESYIASIIDTKPWVTGIVVNIFTKSMLLYSYIIDPETIVVRFIQNMATRDQPTPKNTPFPYLCPTYIQYYKSTSSTVVLEPQEQVQLVGYIE